MKGLGLIKKYMTGQGLHLKSYFGISIAHIRSMVYASAYLHILEHVILDLLGLWAGGGAQALALRSASTIACIGIGRSRGHEIPMRSQPGA